VLALFLPQTNKKIEASDIDQINEVYNSYLNKTVDQDIQEQLDNFESIISSFKYQ
jgi:hypothetical protein